MGSDQNSWLTAINTHESYTDVFFKKKLIRHLLKTEEVHYIITTYIGIYLDRLIIPSLRARMLLLGPSGQTHSS